MFSCNQGVHGQRQRAFLTQNCFSQEVLEYYFSMGCIIGVIRNDLESDLQNSLHEKLKETSRKESRKNKQIHGKLQQTA